MAQKPHTIEELIKSRTISQIVNTRIVTANITSSVGEAIQIMQDERAGYVVLKEGNAVAGIFTETDVVRKILDQKVDPSVPVADYMTKTPGVLKPSDSIGDAIDLMVKKSFYHVPLVDDGNELVGMLSVRSLIRFLAEFYPNEVFNLPPNSNQISETQEGG